MLTKKMAELLAYIDKALKETGAVPSYDEMKAALGLNSKSGVHRLISSLEERGAIRRIPYRARAIEIVEQSIGGLGDTFVIELAKKLSIDQLEEIIAEKRASPKLA